MLVVIAIIGILAAVVLIALGPARNKARDTRIISDVDQARALAETQYNGSFSALPNNQSAVLCNTGSTDKFVQLSCDIQNNGGPGLGIWTTQTSQTSIAYVFYAVLNGGNSVYCVDSNGIAATIPNTTVPPRLASYSCGT